MRELVHVRLREAVSDSGRPVKEIASMARMNQRTLERWLSLDPPYPNVIEFSRVAHVLGKPVEWFTDSEWSVELVPPRLKNVVSVLHDLSDDDLATVEALSKNLLDREQKKREVSDSAPIHSAI